MEIRPKLKKWIVNKWGDICRRSHYVLMGLPFVLLTASLVLSIASVVRINQVLDGQGMQYGAEEYESKRMPYRQMTVVSTCLPQMDGSAPLKTMNGLDVEKVKSLHEAIEITEGSTVGKNGQKKGGEQIDTSRLWKDCYSSFAYYPARGIIEKNETGTIQRCEVVGVSGAYEVVHPLRYECGGFLPGEEGDQTAIVLNTKMAWNLFHSYDIAGAFVEMNGIVFQVAGVVNEGDDAIAEKTGVNDARCYVAFPMLVKLANGPEAPINSSDMDSSLRLEDLAVMNYEVLMVDPIKNIAKNDLTKAMTDSFGYNKDSLDIQVINNTGRFNVLTLWKKYFPLKNAYTGFADMTLPFHERSARLAEQYVVFWAEMLIASIILMLTSGGYIYAIFHGKKTKHAKVEEEEETISELPDIQRV